MEHFGGNDLDVIVDYAHTPDALANVLRAARDATRGNVIVVFGCGGDRDRGKRPEMGRIAFDLADRAIVTSDNPRGEAPQAIIDEILAGLAPGKRIAVEPDRRSAIRLAIGKAEPGDLVVIAGKGHETYQIVGCGALALRRSRRGASPPCASVRARRDARERRHAGGARGERRARARAGTFAADAPHLDRYAHVRSRARRSSRCTARTSTAQRFVRAALDRGALALVVSDASVVPEGVPALVVADTNAAYRAFAAAARRSLRARVVAITGSTGKTTTKSLLAQLLDRVGLGRIAATPANENNEIGVSKLFVSLDDRTDIVVVEFGCRHYGDIEPLVEIARPDIAILTNLGDAHLEIMGSRERLIETKFGIFARGALPILNAADPDSPRPCGDAAARAALVRRARRGRGRASAGARDARRERSRDRPRRR